MGGRDTWEGWRDMVESDGGTYGREIRRDTWQRDGRMVEGHMGARDTWERGTRGRAGGRWWRWM